MVCDLRGGTYFEHLAEVIDELDAAGIEHRVLFLTAAEDTLITRYKETRRRHPLAGGRQVLPTASGARPSCWGRSASAPTS